MRASLKCSRFMVLFNFFVFAYLSLPYLPPPVGVAPEVMRFGKGIAGFWVLVAFFMIAAFMFTTLTYHCCRAVRKRIFQKNRIGEIFVSIGLITPDELAAALSTQSLKIGEILMKKIQTAEIRRDRAPAGLKNNYVKMGEILVTIGFSTDDEIQWALSQKKKKLVKILKEKNLITAFPSPV